MNFKSTELTKFGWSKTQPLV